MGLFDKIFGGRRNPRGTPQGFFKTLTAYSPSWQPWGGNIYESELVRAAIHARATHISKLAVTLQGTAKPKLRTKLKQAPNIFQTWSQFLYRTSTILDVQNTAFIVPVLDEFGEVSGIYPVLPSRCELRQYAGEPWLVYKFSHVKEEAAIELRYCGILTKHQYKSDFKGDQHGALTQTMQLLAIQNQGIAEAVKTSGSYRFMATLNNFSQTTDLAKERKRFSAANLAADSENTGLLLFPNTYGNVQQIKPENYVADAETMKVIRTNIYNYFGVNEDILQNAAFGDKWSAFYEGVVEAFAIQFSEVVSKMLFTLEERNRGNRLMLTANRLQYMSNADKLAVSAQLLDRGIFSLNEVREIWNLPPIENGDAHIIRGEYYDLDEKAVGTADE